ncbi:ubiquitin carboxyl-terminal hydrolase BAP1 [Caerostris darwini]|uniref:Ubiquitin carboxyl-terminal hydrolase n=1 Tax=Caerostris darwini TaxID=1538125 RepID=A0AAV4PU69_9ARAC|nr:ubiquitin carboxyl-terminal hydrolase BAP1 [Caerostris darwini]
MPADLNRLTEGWLELESDPGLFTLLLEDFGVRGVQVEEVYDLQKTIEGPVYGFIFLFKWIEERRSRRKVTASEENFVEDEETINSIFFAQQMVPNSCATHALLSVLLNCPKIYLGPTLARLKEHTANMNPENKGYAIGNTPELARAHNSHAKPEPRNLHEKSHGISTGRTVEAFHFVSYVPIGGRLFELDGLKPYPIDHGPFGEDDWTEKFRRVMTERLGLATAGEPYHDVRFNLMAVVPDRRIAYEHKLRTLKTNRQIVLEALQQLVKLTHPELTSDDHAAVVAAMKSKPPSSTEDENTQPYSLDSKQKNADQSSPYPKLPAALDSHNYAKSPLMEGKTSGRTDCQPHYEDYSGSEYSDDDSKILDKEDSIATPESSSNPDTKTSDGNDSPMTPLSIDTSSDLMKPLSIQTKFETSPAPSASSTDTSSEVGSAFNSPIQSMHCNFSQGSPNSIKSNRTSDSIFDDVRDIKKFLVIRMTSGCDNDQLKSAAVSSQSGQLATDSSKRNIDQVGDSSSEDISSKKLHAESTSSEGNPGSVESKDKNYDDKAEKNENADQFSKSGLISKHPQLIEPHRFAPKDLLALLKTVETEIELCELNLFDEIEKRKKYKIDDCRRTHNYDQFICTFLSMLAEQGKLADLVEQQLVVRRRQGVAVGRLHKAKKPDKRRRSRPKKRK